MTVAKAGFNTASGRYCCNDSIEHMFKMSVLFSFNTASGRYCCNMLEVVGFKFEDLNLFQYRTR